MTDVAINKIYANPTQPRSYFNRRRLEELAESIKENGLLEPIILTERKNGYMIIAGERRYRAVKIAGLKKVSARVIKADDQKVAELSLLENLQREDLNLIEEALAYKNLIDLGLGEDEVAKKMGFKQTWRVRERLDLLRLSSKFQKYLIHKWITPSQAYELSRLPCDKQEILYEKIAAGKADTYNKLRALANALLVPQPQQTMIGPAPSKEEITVGKKYDRVIERLVMFVKGAFDKDELKILKKVTSSNVSVNIEKLNLIIGELNKIKKAMIEAESKREIKG